MQDFLNDCSSSSRTSDFLDRVFTPKLFPSSQCSTVLSIKSSRKDPRPWNILNFLTSLDDILLAVIEATHPLLNTIRAFTKSMQSVRNLCPIAWTEEISELTISNTRSTSWIIISRATLQLAARSLKGDSRWASMNRGFLMRSRV